MELLVERPLDLPPTDCLSVCPEIGIVVPCFNEQEVLPETCARLTLLLEQLKEAGKIAGTSAIYFVDDGSSDRTWALIRDFAAANSAVRGIKLSTNKGHQNALLCGLMTASGDALVSIDADLQDDLAIIPEMIARFSDGMEVVYAVRKRRTADTFLKRLTAEAYYSLMAAMGAKIVFNHADYRLLGRRALESLREYPETHVFLRGLVPQLGYRSAVVEYERAARFAGESKYPLKKMLSFAWTGITSFTAYPLRLITGLGAMISTVSLGLGGWALVIRIFTDSALPGWASTVVPMYLLGGLQLLSLGPESVNIPTRLPYCSVDLSLPCPI